MGYWKKSKKHVSILTKLNKKINSQKKKLEQTLNAFNKKSQETDHILKVVAHDLRNPISAIYTLARMLKDDDENEIDSAEYLDLIQNASKESLELINSIVQVGVGNNLKELHKTMLDINGIVSICVQHLKVRAAEKNQKLILHLPDEPQTVFADADKIHRVIKNLVVNAIKFSHKGSTIHVSVKQKERNIVIEVKDQGIGIPMHLEDKVFDIFTEAKRPGTDQEKTFGLGLSICKQFVEAHNGKIWFNSKENEGTSFYVQLCKQDFSPTISDYGEAS
jgi:signal transduction histidine kinase